MIDINISKVCKSFGFDLILNNIDITVQKGEKVGLIGTNGSGKSTILKIIAGQESIDSGSLSIRNEAGQIVSDARARAKNEYQNKMDQTKEEIALMRENARKDIEAEKQKTIAGLQTEIAGIALMAASKVVEKEANDKGNEKLLDDFLKEAPL